MNRYLAYTLCGLCLFSPLSLAKAPAAQAEVITQLSVRELDVRGEGADAASALAQTQKNALNTLAYELTHTEAEQNKLVKYLPTLHAQQAQYLERLHIVAKGTLPSGGRFYVIRYRVNVKALKDTLIAQQIIPPQSEINEALLFPTLAVYFKDPLNQSEAAQWSIERCNSLLINQGFQVIDPTVWHRLALEDQQLNQNKGVNAQRTALKARANVFLEIDVAPQVVGRSGDYQYVQTPVSIRAFESSSGQPFLEKAYQRLNAKGEPEALAIAGNLDVSTKAVVEEAVAGVMPMIIQDLTRHWKESLVKGKQYRLAFKPPLNPVAQKRLESLVKTYTPGEKGDIWVRYAGELSDLADSIEETLSPGYTLQRMDLGHAYFESP